MDFKTTATGPSNLTIKRKWKNEASSSATQYDNLIHLTCNAPLTFKTIIIFTFLTLLVNNVGVHIKLYHMPM